MEGDVFEYLNVKCPDLLVGLNPMPLTLHSPPTPPLYGDVVVKVKRGLEGGGGK